MPIVMKYDWDFSNTSFFIAKVPRFFTWGRVPDNNLATIPLHIDLFFYFSVFAQNVANEKG